MIRKIIGDHIWIETKYKITSILWLQLYKNTQLKKNFKEI